MCERGSAYDSVSVEIMSHEFTDFLIDGSAELALEHLKHAITSHDIAVDFVNCVLFELRQDV